MIDHITMQYFESFIFFIEKNGYNGMKNLTDIGHKYTLTIKKIVTFTVKYQAAMCKI